MANNPTVVIGSLNDEELKKSIDKLVNHVDQQLNYMVSSTKVAVMSMNKSLKSLGDTKIDFGGSADGGASKRAKAQNAETVAVKESTQAYKEKTLTLDQQASAINTAVQSEKKYTDEVLRQAAAIRSSKEWQEKGHVVIGDVNYYDKERANVSKRDKQLLLSLEEQILQVQKNEADAIQKAAQEARMHAQAQKEVQEAAMNTSRILQTMSHYQTNVYEAQRESTKIMNGKYGAGISSFAQFDDLQVAISRVIGVEHQQVKIVDESYDSYKRLSASLSQLKAAYNSLNESERNSDNGRILVQKMQLIERSMQKIQAQASRPISLSSVMGLSEKTLDDIAYKMRQLASYRSGLNIETQRNEIDQINKKYAELQKSMNDIMKKNTDMIASNTALGRSWNYMKNRLAFYFTVGASTSFVKQLIDVRGQYELLERSIGILIDSMQNGSQVFAELNAMAIKSPFTTMELGAAAKQLVAYDVAAKDVVDTTKRLADMAAAVGIPIERLTYALGQIKAYGYLNARDARMFANAGIPLVKELADYYTQLEGRLVSTADVYDRIKKKAIDYNDVMSVVNKMTDEGGKFFDFQEKAADTLKVRIANLTLAWNNMLNEMGKDNQGVLTEGLKITKQIFESWRDINNIIISLAYTYGTLKAAQIAYYLWVMRTEKTVGAWSKIINAIDYAFNAKIANVINSLKTSFVGFFTNPVAMATVAFTALSVAITKAYLDYRDLQAANEEFNKSVVKNAEENVKSIDKFFGEYQKQLESVGSLNSADQTKLWERVQEEIEKTTKNAEKYIEILNKIPEISKRIEMGEDILEQSKRIQDELKRMAERGMFNIGGGFANDSAAKDLQQYSNIVNELIAKYGNLEKAKQEALKVNEITLESGEVIKQYTGEYTNFQRAQIEAEKELQNVVSILDKANIAEIMGLGDMDTQLANVRSFAIAWRDAFLATEQGSKISAEGQALLNSYIDKWVEKQARVNHLIKDENTAAVEANRTAWEEFFKFLNTEERKRLDVAIKTNQLGSKSVQELWDKAAERMQEKATTSYNLIQEQIADLRNTPDIVINVVYRNNKEKLDKDQEEFEKRYIQPEGSGVLDADTYLKKEKANREKYGTLMRKQGEDTAEYEKRISDERKNQLELSRRNADIIEENKNKTDDYAKAVTAQAKKEKQAADDRLKVIKEVEDAGGYDFSTKKENADARKNAKQAETELQKALKDELSTIEKVRSIYKDLTKEGMSHANAVERATKGWDETVNAINRVLQKNGLQKLDLSKFAGIENPRELVNMLQSQLNTLIKRGAKPAEIKELQTKIQTLNVDAEKYDLTKITKGLNNELGKLKDEYELAVELDADPELGGIFADMFDLSVDQLPHSISEYAERVTAELNKAIKDRGDNIQLPTIYLTKDDIDAFRKMSENGKLNTKSFEDIQKAYQDFMSLRKKAATDVSKIASDYIREYGDLSAQIKQIEIEKNDAMTKLNEIYNTEALRQTQRYLDAKVAIEDGARRKSAKATFEALKKESDYERFFTAIDTFTTKDALNVKNRIKKGIIDAFTNGGLTVAQFRKEIKALEEQFDKLSESTSNWVSYLNGGFDKLIQRAKNTGQELEVIGEKMRATGKVDEKDKNFLDSFGSIFSDKQGNKMGFTSLVKSFGGDIKGLGKSVSQAGQGMQAGASGFAGAVAIVDMIIKNIHQTVQAIDSVIQELNSTRNEDHKIGSAYWEGFKKFDNYAFSGWENLKSGNIAGALADTASSIISIFNTFENAKNERINDEIKESERTVRKLELAYTDLEHAVQQAYGMATIGANMAAKANKELQLAELRRQLALEESRSEKRRDEDRIVELRKQIKELEYDIADTVDSIVNDLLGISSIGDAMENMMDAFVDALRSGEDAMAKFDESVDEMIANMVKKMFTTKILQPWFEEQWNKIQSQINERASDLPNKLAEVQSRVSNAKMADVNDNDSLVRALRDLGFDEETIHRLNWYDETGMLNAVGRNARLRSAYEKALKEAEQKEAELQRQLTNATSVTVDDIKSFAGDLETGRPLLQSWYDEIDNTIKELGLMYDTNKSLSNLQQGIAGITEDTAGALEAYMNGVSQQVYLHSDLLTQIRDAVVGMDMDVQVATQAQMLLQLQQSYAVQMAIQGILEGVLNPSGRAFSVELVS